VRYAFDLFVVLFAAWLVWSGHYVPLLITLGALSCLGMVALCVRMRIVDREAAPMVFPHRALVYLPWLMWQIVKANIHVALRILHPRLPIHPNIVRVRPSQRTDMGRVIYANSITLTPGTLSLHVSDQRIVVHALTEESAADLRQEPGSMDRRITRLEER
jgi:multicomponent Na+:H+ antiporter subunit E